MKTLIKGVAKDDNVARISVVGLDDTPGIALKLFNKLDYVTYVEEV